MATVDAVQEIARQLAAATTFVAVFGRLPSGGIDQQVAALRRKYFFFAKQVHPDHAPTAVKEQATEVFQLLRNLYEAAEDAARKGAYEQTFAPGFYRTNGRAAAVDTVVLQSALAIYRLSPIPLWRGDFSSLYRAVALGSDQQVLVKIAVDPTVNALLEWEAKVVLRFHNPTATGKLVRIRPYVPKLLDTFVIAGERGQRFRANVLAYRSGLVSLAEILTAYPDGLDPRDAAWIFRRILSQTLAATMIGVVHGALVPDHVLVDPLLHDPVHIGWLHAIDNPQTSNKRITMLIDRWRDWYPPEVLRKQKPDHRTDLYMAGKTMMRLVGGDTARNTLPRTVPDTIGQIIRQCVSASPARRPDDGRAVLDGITRAIRDAWGKAYRPLSMPVRS